SAAHLILLFFFNATATPEIYTLSLHDALPICSSVRASTGTMRTGRGIVQELWGSSETSLSKKASESGFPLITLRRGHIALEPLRDRKSTRLNSSHVAISYAVFCLKKKKKPI